MRSLLFVAGDSAKKLEKAIDSGADALIIDLEDSVAVSEKVKAREICALDGLSIECREASCDGFVGKMAIHPAQVPIISEAFTPSSKALARASAIVDAFAQNLDAGVIGLEGRDARPASFAPGATHPTSGERNGQSVRS